MVLGGGFSLLWYLLGSAAPKLALVRFSLGTRMLERGRVTPLLLGAAPGCTPGAELSSVPVSQGRKLPLCLEG